MSYQTAKTIKEVIKYIDERKYLLPSIQREFVWNTDQIERLFDSIMQEYPINAFLFWEVPRNKIHDFKFYEFIRDYNQLINKHNPTANLNGLEEILAILDGQQRLSSLYIGLKGSYAYKIPNKRWDNPAAYPKRKLYLNLFAPSKTSDLKYDFRFLTEEEAKKIDTKHYWFPVGEILNFSALYDVSRYLNNNNITLNNYDEELVIFASNTLNILFSAIHQTPTISYYLEKSEELDKVLNIFIRVNSGGTTLSYSDLLLSFATTQWEKGNAREEINGFIDEINQIHPGFNIKNDVLLKACLMLCDISDISFKVDNFNHNNMITIENEWDNIKNAYRIAVELVASFGFSRENITSNTLFTPIAYYIKSIGIPNNFVDSMQYLEDRKLIKKWFISSLIKRVFSFVPDGVLKPVRDIIKTYPNTFPLDHITNRFKNTNRDISFTKENIDNLLTIKYKAQNAMVLLALIYPWINFKYQNQIDHIFPKSLMTEKKLKQRGYSEEKIKFYLEHCDSIANLQLLNEIPNKEKSCKEFDAWLNEIFSDEISKNDYMTKHYIPKIDLDFNNFENFIKEREKLILEKLYIELL